MLPRTRSGNKDGLLGWLRGLDGYAFKRIDEAASLRTASGGFVSVAVLIALAMLSFVEVWGYLSPQMRSEVVLDGASDATTRLSFNISFPRVPCGMISLEVRDALGRELLHEEKRITKSFLDPSTAESSLRETFSNPTAPKYEELAEGSSEKVVDGEEASVEVTALSFDKYVQSHQLVGVAFTADWCSHCQRLKPTWNKVAEQLRAYDDQVRLVRVECTDVKASSLCRDFAIRQYPSILLFNQLREGISKAPRGHAAPTGQFFGDRTPEAILQMLLFELEASVREASDSTKPPGLNVGALKKEHLTSGSEEEKKEADSLTKQLMDHAMNEAEHIGKLMKDLNLPIPAPLTMGLQRMHEHAIEDMKKRDPAHLPGLKADPSLRGEQGCMLQGFLDIARVPGSMTFAIFDDGSSFIPETLNMTHHVSRFRFGQPIPPHVSRKLAITEALGHESLAGKTFISKKHHASHEHYLRIIGSSYSLLDGTHIDDAFRYAASSRSFTTKDTLPHVRFDFDINAVRTLNKEQREPFYRFIIGLCAVVGGVLSVANLLDSALDNIRKKAFLNKLH